MPAVLACPYERYATCFDFMCVHTSTHARTHARICTRAFARTYTQKTRSHTRTGIHALSAAQRAYLSQAHTCDHARVHRCAYMHARSPCTHACILASVCACMHMCVCMRACAHVSVRCAGSSCWDSNFTPQVRVCAHGCMRCVHVRAW